MGLLDTIFGRSKPVAANLDDLFGLPSAAVTLQVAGGMTFNGRAGVCWKPPAGQAPEDVQEEIEELLAIDDHDNHPAVGSEETDRAGTGSEASSGSEGAASPTSTDAPGPGASVGQLTQSVDSYGYRWLLLEDPSIDDLVARVHLVNTMLAEAGWGPQLLCSVFSLSGAAGESANATPTYLVYLYKRGTFYPFAPSGKEQRDNEVELRIRSIVSNDLKIESDISRWFPLWDLPVH